LHEIVVNLTSKLIKVEQINLINDTATKFYLLNFVIFINFAGGEYARFHKLSPSAY